MGDVTDATPHWTPSPERIAAAQLTRFHDFARGRGREQGCYKLALSSGMPREAAHRFYESLGFRRHGYSFWTET